MSTIKISELTPVETLTENDVFPIINGTETRKTSLLKLQDIFASKSYVEEKIKNITVDLSNYYTKSETDDKINENKYNLPVATDTTLGGIKVGDNLEIDSEGVLSAIASGGGSSFAKDFYVIDLKGHVGMPTRVNDGSIDDEGVQLIANCFTDYAIRHNEWGSEVKFNNIVILILDEYKTSILYYGKQTGNLSNRIYHLELRRMRFGEYFDQFSISLEHFEVEPNETDQTITITKIGTSSTSNGFALSDPTQLRNRVVTKDNTTSYTPTSDYNPATKKYVDDTVKASITTALESDY